MEIYNRGSAIARNVSLKVKSSNNHLEAKLQLFERNKETYGFFKKNSSKKDTILTVSGFGHGMIELIAEYNDEVENLYSTVLAEFPVFVEHGKEIRIPLTQSLFQTTLFEKG